MGCTPHATQAVAWKVTNCTFTGKLRCRIVSAAELTQIGKGLPADGTGPISLTDHQCFAAENHETSSILLQALSTLGSLGITNFKLSFAWREGCCTV